MERGSPRYCFSGACKGYLLQRAGFLGFFGLWLRRGGGVRGVVWV